MSVYLFEGLNMLRGTLNCVRRSATQCDVVQRNATFCMALFPEKEFQEKTYITCIFNTYNVYNLTALLSGENICKCKQEPSANIFSYRKIVYRKAVPLLMANGMRPPFLVNRLVPFFIKIYAISSNRRCYLCEKQAKLRLLSLISKYCRWNHSIE